MPIDHDILLDREGIMSLIPFVDHENVIINQKTPSGCGRQHKKRYSSINLVSTASAEGLPISGQPSLSDQDGSQTRSCLAPP